VNRKYSPTGPASALAVGCGRIRPATLTNPRASGSAYNTSPMVAANESWKPPVPFGETRHLAIPVQQHMPPAELRLLFFQIILYTLEEDRKRYGLMGWNMLFRQVM
jgi:hypothetical protein